jgi:hypothetical protein
MKSLTQKVDSPISSEENKVAPVNELTIISQPTVIPEKWKYIITRFAPQKETPEGISP